MPAEDSGLSIWFERTEHRCAVKKRAGDPGSNPGGSTMKTGIKAVCFDSGGVLVTMAYPDTIKEIAKACKVSANRLEPVMKKYLDTMGTGKISENILWEKISKELGKKLPLKQCKAAWRKVYASRPMNKEMVSLTKQLQKKGYKICLVSNIVEPHAEVAEKLKRYDHFDYVIMSCRVGAQKPSPKIYKLATKRLKLQPNQCVFTDDIKAHVDAAKKLGFIGVHFKNPKQFKIELKKYGVGIK